MASARIEPRSRAVPAPELPRFVGRRCDGFWNSTMILVGLSGLRQLEHGHFGPDVEAHLREMSDTSVDVETTVAGELYFTSYVSPIPHRQERRRQERRLALPTVCVPRQNPTLVRAPAWQVHRVGVVAQDESGSRAVELCQPALRPESVGPQIVEPDDLKAANL